MRRSRNSMENACPNCHHTNSAQAKLCESCGIEQHAKVASSNWHKERVLIITVLGIIMVLGLLLRLDNLGTRSMSHAELYVPNIELPLELSIPSPRVTLWQNLTGTVWNTHPPAWYLSIMWPWTKLLGSDLFLLRLPSVLFGVASILLIYALGNLENDKSTALLSGGLLAFNGHHIFWSQLARPYSVSCFLGLLTSVLLLLLLRNQGQPRRIILWFYLASAFYALATDYHLWMIFVSQILWVFMHGWMRNKLPMGLLLSQLCILILASPLVGIAILQTKASSLSNDLLLFLEKFIQFGFIYYEPYDPVAQDIVPRFSTISAILFLFAASVFIIGIVSKQSAGQLLIKNNVWKPSLGSLAIASVIALGCIGLIATVSLEYGNYYKTYAIIATSVIPVFILALAFILERYSANTHYLEWLKRIFLLKNISSISSFLVIVPILMFAVVNLLIPFFSSRTLLILTPFLFVVLSRGIVATARKVSKLSVILPGTLLVLLVAVHYFGIVIHRQRPSSPVDYQGLAEQWIPKMQNTDLVFVQRHYILTPIFYYMKADRYRFVGANYVEEVRKSSNSRVWVVSFEGRFDYGVPTEEMRKALAGHELVTRINARRINVGLYRRFGQLS